MSRLTDSRSGCVYNAETRVAREEGISHLYITQISPKLWRFLHWDLVNDSASCVGPHVQSKLEAMLIAHDYAKFFGFDERHIEAFDPHGYKVKYCPPPHLAVED